MNESIAYLIELRQRLLHYFLVLGVVFIVLALFANHVYRVLTLPLLHHIANNAALIAISVPAPFLVPLKSALIVSVFITMPYLLYQLWCFIVPGLYRQERKLLWGLLFSSILLFYLGVAFAYTIVLPLVFQFFIAIAINIMETKAN